jgi:hypothetical protein
MRYYWQLRRSGGGNFGVPVEDFPLPADRPRFLTAIRRQATSYRQDAGSSPP